MQVITRSFSMVLALSMILCVAAGPASAQWYDDKEVPPGSGEMRNGFALKSYDMGTGGHVSSWIAPGDDILGLSFLVQGGYMFEQFPLFLNLQVPLAYGMPDSDLIDPEFVIGNVGIGLQYRLDPANPLLGVHTGWSFDIFFPTFMGDSTDMSIGARGLGQTTGFFNSLMTSTHYNPESINVQGAFDLLLPGHLLFFQVEVGVSAYFPIADTDQRSIEGAMLWGALFGVHIIEQLAFLVELKGYTPFGVEDEIGTAAPSLYGLSTGLRLNAGVFKPAVWVTFPLDQDYRQSWPDIIIGLDLAAWM